MRRFVLFVCLYAGPAALASPAPAAKVAGSTPVPFPVVDGRMALAALPRGGLIAGGSFGGMEFRATSGLARFGR